LEDSFRIGVMSSKVDEKSYCMEEPIFANPNNKDLVKCTDYLDP
jgi:hypothetical protein